VYEVSEDRSNRLPPWDPQTRAEPPLSTGAAIRAAEAWLIARNPEIKAFEPSTVALMKASPPNVSAGTCQRLECWYYRVTFDPVVSGRRLTGGNFVAIVLMDGSVVNPAGDPLARTAAGASAANGDTTIYRVGNGVSAPQITRQVTPQYTSAALREKIQGRVMVEMVVKTDGTVGDVRIVQSLDAVYGLDDEAIKAARQWRFSPAMRNGQPVPVVVAMELTFTIGR
jgi:TonB family protein